jgi:hypothetical protein
MKRLALLAAVAAGLMVTPAAGAQSGLGGLGWRYPGAPGPFAGPNSRIDYADGRNNGTDLVLFCHTQIDQSPAAIELSTAPPPRGPGQGRAF